jgi:uncharacterized membrane protein
MGGVKGHFRFDSFYCRNHNGGVTSPIVYNTIDDRFTNETSTLLNKLGFMQVKFQQIMFFIFFNIDFVGVSVPSPTLFKVKLFLSMTAEIKL